MQQATTDLALHQCFAGEDVDEEKGVKARDAAEWVNQNCAGR